MKRRNAVVAMLLLAIGGVGWVVVEKLRGPVFDGHQVRLQPLVQTVVATGRVVAVSRAQVGSPVTGVVMER